MSESTSQNLKNHTRFHPPVHFFLMPVALINVVVAVVHFTHHLNFISGWLVVLSFALVMLVLMLRLYSLKVQDRVIRLEERLRLQSLAPAEWHAQLVKLTEDQLIGLRFAADDEVVELAKQALAESLSRKQIKERIKSWRADNWRV